MGWTKEQEEAINLRNANLLVSAAAGSGKTAVLVERIVKMVCEEDYAIDKILVMTFTKAAAAEMKERIGARLLEEGIKNPDNPKIQEQLAYIHKAPISTIHSFCMDLLRNHFHLISLDPNFRIGEEGEAALLKEQVLDEMLEECYEEKNEDFLRLIEAYSYGKDDRAVCDMILRLFDFSRSHPEPNQWLADACHALDTTEKEPEWISQVMDYSERILRDALSYTKDAIALCEKDATLFEKYVPVFKNDREEVEKLLAVNTYEERAKAFENLTFTRMPAIRKKEEIHLDVMEEVKEIRDEVKTMVNNLKDDFFLLSLDEIRKESKLLKPYVSTLVELTKRFGEKFLECKLEKNMLEFGDLEHFALELLVESYEDGKVKKTTLAQELSDFYQAVFTDEYQDSNLIQEVLLQSVSREEDGNRFMVGDIKQSIYKFRMARPELFLEKYDTYGEEGLNRKIELKNNFRSRPEVLYSINYIFYQIMKPSLGDVNYEKKVALTPPETATKDTKQQQELLLLDMAGNKEFQADGGEDYTSIELEARMVAERIKALEGVPYKDMVILLRTVEGWAQIFEDVLGMEGIPVHTESRTGYFDAFEIRVLINLLSVVDNIYQDIPLAAVLRSPIGGFSGEDLAQIRSLVIQDQREEDSLYDEMVFYAEAGENDILTGKIRKVLTLIGELRSEKTWMSLEELIWSALEKTGYYHLAGSMPNGEQRMANIRMFLEKARQYEKTSFKGVFHFLQYIDQLRSYEIDYGEASVLGEEADVVRIMSIHKSKGLEFPIVFLCGLGKQFNFMDRNQRMLLHPDYYLGLDCIYLESHSKKVSQQKKMIGKQLVLSMLGEELRVLYVAMTRAKEKLIMTGAIKDFNQYMLKYANRSESQLGFSAMTKAKTYLQWILPALLRHPVTDSYKKSRGIEIDPSEYFSAEGEEPCFCLKVTAPFELIGGEIIKKQREQGQREDFMEWVRTDVNSEAIQEIEKELSWVYPKEKELGARSKWSVSQLKEEREEKLFVPVEQESAVETEGVTPSKERLIPSFLKEKEEILTGAGRGTAVHKLLEVLSFSKVEEMGLESAIEELVKAGRYPKEYVKSLPLRQIETFYASSLASRMRKAEQNGTLYKEAQFMMGVPMKEMEPETESEELVLLQGVIDLYLEEEDGLVLLDYKTDYVKRGEEEKLISRYEGQLHWYKRALEQMTNKPVKETILYSFSLSRALSLYKRSGL